MAGVVSVRKVTYVW